MKNKEGLTKFLAVSGTLLVWLPILFTIAISVIGTAYTRVFRFDYLLPAELFPVALAGALVLLWAAWRADYQRKRIGLSLIAMLVFLLGGQAIAVLTGLASGAAEPTGLPWLAVTASLAIYSFSIIAIGIAGISLLKKLWS